jgi:hypothetical protein
MNVMVQINTPFLDLLRAEATELGLSLEQLAGTILECHARTRAGGKTVISDDVFRRAMADTFRENDALYERLAK